MRWVGPTLVALGIASAVAVLVSFAGAIWTGDIRWFGTGLLMLAPTLVFSLTGSFLND